MSAGKPNRVSSRRGFTLVELLVVIAIIGVLVGLLMPAIVNARLTALQATCANNQRELATAILLFDSNKDRLPYVGRSDRTYGTWYAQILEELGRGKENEQIMNGSNSFTVAPIKQFKCPVSDSATNGFNFMVNVGSQSNWSNAKTSNPANKVRGAGLFFFYYGDKNKSYTKSSISSIKDGASQTILLSEKCWKRVPGHSGDINTEFSPAENWASSSGDTNTYKKFGLMWDGSAIDTTKFSNFPTSRHSQINNVAFADGSVKAVSKSIKYETFKSLMCPSDSWVGFTVNLGNDPNYKE